VAMQGVRGTVAKAGNTQGLACFHCRKFIIYSEKWIL